jgi:hypothetical protein
MSENPATPDVIKHSLNNFCMVDVRPRLKEPYASRDGYPGYALAPPMCRIPVALFLSSDGQPLPLDKTLLLRVINFIQERYAEHRGMAVAYIAQASEMFGYAMKQGYVANESVLLSLDHFAVAYFGDTRRTPSNHCYMFSSDGPGEKFLDSTFTNSSGKPELSLLKFFTSINLNISFRDTDNPHSLICLF